MAKSTLQQLFDGEIFPSENIRPNNPVYNEAKKTLDEETQAFMNSLSGDNLEHFQRIKDLYFKTESIYSYECFTHGFRLAVSLMVESMSGTDKSYWQ